MILNVKALSVMEFVLVVGNQDHDQQHIDDHDNACGKQQVSPHAHLAIVRARADDSFWGRAA
jgi:hypothetical protein